MCGPAPSPTRCVSPLPRNSPGAPKTGGLDEEHILPTMEEWEVYPREAAAVGRKAIEQGVARLDFTREELLEMATRTIKRAREEVEVLMREGLIPSPPEVPS